MYILCTAVLIHYVQLGVIKFARLYTILGRATVFKTDSAERQKLEELAATLIPTCKTKYFGERAIRQHIFDSLTEKKRRIRKGVDYTKVSMCEICIIDIKLVTMIIMQQPNDYNDYSMHINIGCICFATQ